MPEQQSQRQSSPGIMPRSRSSGRPAPRPAPRPAAKQYHSAAAHPPAPVQHALPPAVQSAHAGGSMFGGLAGTIVQGIGFGAGSAVAHRAVDSLMGPRQVEHGVAHTEAEPRVVFVLGGPESGKGTQCAKVVENYGFKHLSAGDLLHAKINSGSENGTMIQNMINEGKIVPSEVTVKLIQKAMEQSKTDKFLIDGFPQNEENRATFESVTGIAPEFILFFDCPEDEMERRLLQRNQGRVDDNTETIRKRFKVFVESSLLVVEYYESIGKVRKINATRSVEEIFDSIQPLFKLFGQDDLLQVSQRLLDGIDRADYEVYRLFDEVACFMREDARKVVWEAAIEDIFEHSCSFTPEKLTSSGVRDPDDPRKERSSPLLKLLFDENVSYLDMNRQGERYFQNSLVKLLEDVWNHHEIFAGLVLRL